jgi:hypothetical protein
MSNERFTDLPTVANALPTDIICAVQGYVSPSSPGVSVQETLQQVLNLGLSNTILNYAGNPNGNVAGVTYQLLWDSTDQILWVNTTSGSTSTAVWTKANQGDGVFIWNNVTTATQAMLSNNGYVINDGASLVTLTLPTISGIGDEIKIVGNSASGWSIAYSTNQFINIGISASTTTTGHVASTNATDSVTLVCTTANLGWTALSLISAGLTIV